jgi:hypothetical protein
MGGGVLSNAVVSSTSGLPYCRRNADRSSGPVGVVVTLGDGAGATLEVGPALPWLLPHAERATANQIALDERTPPA